MVEKLLRDETPIEFFKEQLNRAMEHQKVAASAFTEFYLVNLLLGGVRGECWPAAEPGYDETPLALVYGRALQASRLERLRLLRMTGDTALFVSGFFADSLEGKLASAAYYRAMGGRAYGMLSQEEATGLGPHVFDELSGRFGEFADVLSEVSESSRLAAGNHSVLRLYERWIRTGSRRAAALLAEHGISPFPAPGGESSH